MVTTSENGKKTNPDLTQAAQDTLWRYVDEWNAIGQTYSRAWITTNQSAMKSVLQQQIAVLKAARMVVDAGSQANRDWLDQTADALRTSHQTMSSMADATAQMMDAAIPWVKR